MRLRSILTLVMVGVGAIAVGVALVLVVSTSSMYRTGGQLASATERVRLLMELESFALQHIHGVERSDVERALEITRRLRRSAGEEFAAEIDRLDDMVVALSEAPTPSDRAARFDALAADFRAVVAREDERAQRAMNEAAWWNAAANAIGVAAIVVLLVGVAAVLAWLWRSALQPLVTLVETLGRFAKGDVTARIGEDGPKEVRDVAAAFNEMTLSLANQREQQLAFIGGVAHDLRAPLNTLQVAAMLLDQPAADFARVRDRIRRQISRMDHMIADLLDRTRIETGRFELRRERCDLRDLASHVVDTQRDSESRRDVRLRLPDEPLPICCDPVRIEQVITNLLGNAVKYSPDSSDVTVVVERDASAAVLSVSDRGIGIAASDREKLFEPFRRGRNVGNIAGTGLGLSVTRKIVEAHGGTISVTSELGLGSVFTVRLPLVRDTDDASARFGGEYAASTSAS